MAELRRIAVLTSGGDAPGMNPCIRAVVRKALSYGVEVFGVLRGYQGLIESDFIPLDARAVGGIIQRGGTFLGTMRAPQFHSPQVRDKCLENLERQGIQALVIIGGNGSQAGAHALAQAGFPVTGVPSTIDNDVPFTDITIGGDTALNTILGAIDKIKDTASSLRRAFLIEVMGRGSGYLAMMSGIAGGAEVIVIPEAPTDLEELVDSLEDAYQRGKPHFIAIVAEGAKPDTEEIAAFLRARPVGYEVRVTILGHVQRGGSPTAFDRILATRLGMAAAERLLQGERSQMVGLIGNQIISTPLERVVSTPKRLDLDFYRRTEILER